MLSESSIIAQLLKAFPSHIGDDAAVIHPTPSLATLITKDILVEHKHFKTSYVDAASLAHKALHVNLSDLAAMGAKPGYVLSGIAIPPQHAIYAQSFLDELTKACKAANVSLIGGDTTASDRDLFISITAIGEAFPQHIKYRSTALPGDIICVIGHLGLAHLGLMAFETNQPDFLIEKEAFLKPIAKIQEGLWLGKQSGVTSLMDISDGLLIDLKRLCEASNVGAELKLDALTPNSHFIEACTALQLDPTNVMLTGGEDYGLLLTVSPTDFDFINSAFATEFNEPLMQIGVMTKMRDVRLTLQDNPVKLTLTPFNHFGESL